MDSCFKKYIDIKKILEFLIGARTHGDILN